MQAHLRDGLRAKLNMDSFGIHNNVSVHIGTAKSTSTNPTMETEQNPESSVEQPLAKQQRSESRWSSSSETNSLQSGDSSSAPTTVASTVGSVKSKESRRLTTTTLLSQIMSLMLLCCGQSNPGATGFLAAEISR